MSEYNFDFSMYQALTLNVAKLIPKCWTGNNSPAKVVLLLSLITEITSVYNINADMFTICFLNLKVFFF